jgi:DNA-binding NarL/FixJ family response regulator
VAAAQRSHERLRRAIEGPLWAQSVPEVMNEATLPALRQIGLVASNNLRIEGLRAIFAERLGVELIPLSLERGLGARGLSIVFVDATSTDYLFELLATFRRTRPSIKLIVIAEDTSLKFMHRIIGAGVKGFLPHTATADELLLALQVVQDGSIWAPRKVLAQLLDARTATRPPAGTPNGPRFTPRENQVVHLLVAGKSNREIGQQLGINDSTVKAHMGRILRKVGVNNRIELTMFLLNQHLADES